jgi:hypothetical protein
MDPKESEQIHDGKPEDVFRFGVKWREERSPLVSIPPLWGGDFQGMRVYRSDFG